MIGPTSLDRVCLSRNMMKPLFAVTLLSCALFAGQAVTASAADLDQERMTTDEIVIAPNLESFTLDNGLQLVVIPDRRAPVATHMIWYKVGSADEPEGQSGVAHFLEHLMFKGTTNNPDGAFSKMIAERGGRENAFTSYDYTGYFQRVAKEHLPLMMSLEADRMENLVLSDEVVGPERDVVLEERRSRVDSEPGSQLREAMNAVLFVNHPYGSPIIGWQSEIEALNKDAAIAFYDRFYTPNNAIVVVAGDVDPEDVYQLARETYGKVDRRAEPGVRMRPMEPPLSGERRVSVSDPRVRQESISLTWIVPSQATGDGVVPEALDILAYILGEGPSSRLHKALVLEKEAAVGAGAYYQSSALDQGRFGIYSSPAPGYTLDDMERFVSEQLDLLLEDGVTDEEVRKAQRSMIASAIYAQDSQSGLARLFGSALTSGQTVEDVQTWPSQVRSVTATDVIAAAREYLKSAPVVGELRKADSADTQASSPASTAPEKDS